MERKRKLKGVPTTVLEEARRVVAKQVPAVVPPKERARPVDVKQKVLAALRRLPHPMD